MAKRFKWRFESVKNAKEREEERRRQDLVTAQNALREQETRLADLHNRRDGCRRELREKQTGRINPADLSAIHDYLESLAEQIREQIRQVENARSTEEKKRTALMKSVQENKVLENLKERDYQSFRKTERRKDQSAMDETANRRAPKKRQ